MPHHHDHHLLLHRQSHPPQYFLRLGRSATGPLPLAVIGLLSLVLGLTAIAAEQQGERISDHSPDGRIELTIQLPPAGAALRPTWAARFSGKPVLAGCELSLQTADAGELFSAERRAVGVEARSVHQVIPVHFGKSDRAEDLYRERRLRFHSLSSQGERGYDVVAVFRCYNDAVALRYEIAAGSAGSPITITEEGTSFGVVGQPVAYTQYLEGYRTSHEHNVTVVPWDGIATNTLVDLPLTLAWPDKGAYVAITEAALRHYAGMSLMRLGTAAAGGALVSRLTPRPDGAKVVRPGPLVTPWRVALIADRPGALLESQTLYCLNDAPAIGDLSWIQPGKITFSWWNGDVFDGRPGEPILSVAMAKKYIDFCAANGIPTHSLTSTEGSVTPWYKQSKPGVEPGPDTDVTRPREGFDLAAIREYAESRKVRLWTWVHQGALRGRVEEAFTAFERLGWKGMMVDFFDHDDQENVEFAESILESAARHKILIHLHGVWKPTGWQRTYPNLMNHEGALNLEYLKWSDRCTPDHNVMMAFTRLIAGPMDYHLGGFRSVPRAEFAPRNVAPLVMGTRAHMLAMYVCFDNPAPMVADYPMAYEGQPGFDFLRRVPTWWDETRVPVASVGEYLVTARRKGQDWYLGAMSAKSARLLTVPLRFLDKGNYTVKLWRDRPDAPSSPNLLMVKEDHQKVTRADSLSVMVSVDGGFVAELAPVRP